MLSLTPEHEIVLLGARPSPDEGARLRLAELISSGVDWDAVMATAERHGVLPVVAAAVRGHPALPPGAARQMAAQVRKIAGFNLQMTRELLAVVNALESRGVTAAAFKGPALAAELYGSIALRQFTDLDILVDGADIGRAVRELKERGYTPFPARTELEVAVLTATSGNVSLIHPRLGVTLEIHTQLVLPHRRFGLTAAAALSRSRFVQINGTSIRTLARSDLALYLCAHGTNHEWERLEWVGDLARLVQLESGIEWPALISSARALGHERALLLGLSLCESLFNVKPETGVRLLAPIDQVVLKLVSHVERGLFETEMPPWSPRAISFRASTPRDRVNQLIFRLFRPQLADLRVMPLPARLYFLYYAFRPLRLALARLRPIARRQHGDRLRAT